MTAILMFKGKLNGDKISRERKVARLPLVSGTEKYLKLMVIDVWLDCLNPLSVIPQNGQTHSTIRR